MVIHPYAKIWYAYDKEQRHLARLKSMVKVFYFDTDVIEIIIKGCIIKLHVAGHMKYKHVNLLKIHFQAY